LGPLAFWRDVVGNGRASLERDWPYMWIDDADVKARQNGSIESVAVIIAVGVNTDE